MNTFEKKIDFLYVTFFLGHPVYHKKHGYISAIVENLGGDISLTIINKNNFYSCNFTFRFQKIVRFSLFVRDIVNVKGVMHFFPGQKGPPHP